MTDKDIIGREVAVDFSDEIKGVPAKVDTGADGSAVWASDIFVDKDHVLHFKLFDEGSPYYTGIEHTTKEYSIVKTKSSSGDKMLKYQVKLSITIEGRKICAKFGLSDRSTHNYPILIGRRTINGKFIVDVSKSHNLVKVKKVTESGLNKQMKKNPYEFYKKKYLNGASEK